MHARQSGSGQQLCETALCLSGFKRNAVEEQLVIGDAEKKTAVALFGKRLLQLRPGGFELSLSSFVVEAIQADVFDKDVEAVDERACGIVPALFRLACAGRGNGRTPVEVLTCPA